MRALAALGFMFLCAAALAEQPQTLVARDYRLHYWPGHEQTAQAATFSAGNLPPELDGFSL